MMRGRMGADKVSGDGEGEGDADRRRREVKKVVIV